MTVQMQDIQPAQEVETAANDVTVGERLQPIHASSEYLGKYRSIVHVRDVPDWYLDEPVELGGDNKGPTPLESVLGALCACTSMIVNILRKELRFDVQGMRCEADGVTDVRRAEMKRTGKKFHEVEPIASHFHKVHMRIHIKTSESDERLDEMAAHVARLCPVSKLIEDADVPFNVSWIRD